MNCASERMTDEGLKPCPGKAEWKHPRYEPVCERCKQMWEHFYPTGWEQVTDFGPNVKRHPMCAEADRMSESGERNEVSYLVSVLRVTRKRMKEYRMSTYEIDSVLERYGA